MNLELAKHSLDMIRELNKSLELLIPFSSFISNNPNDENIIGRSIEKIAASISIHSRVLYIELDRESEAGK